MKGPAPLTTAEGVRKACDDKDKDSNTVDNDIPGEFW
ncbi:unnamed protein product [Strongylus vulgaris]|uniref:Uncharacterized protein n=1 Tax=Strongylus vulgaris TaxID=40348 RepID=A0A3P7KV79_STRVU|nr:unnamed protein product [Strongylus vulgaris]